MSTLITEKVAVEVAGATVGFTFIVPSAPKSPVAVITIKPPFAPSKSSVLISIEKIDRVE